METSLLRACMATQSGRYVVVRSGENGTREADYVGESPGYRLYKTSDGWIFLGVRSEEEWERLSRALGERESAGVNKRGLMPMTPCPRPYPKTFASASIC